MRIVDLAHKDLSQILRDWKSALFLLVMPILFTVFFGFVFGATGADKTPKDTRLAVGVIDQDGAVLAAHLSTLMAASDVIRPVALEREDTAVATNLVEDGKYSAIVIVPAGYTDRILVDRPAVLKVIVDRNEPAGQTAYRALETVTGRLMGSVEAGHISLAAAEEHATFSSEEARRKFLEDNTYAAVAGWKQPPLTVAVVKGAGAVIDEEPESTPGGFAQSSPGMMVQFAIFGLITSSMVLVTERKSGTLRRLLSSPMTRAELIGGHTLAMFLVVFMQLVILVLLGQFLFDVNYLRQPLAVLLMIIVLAVWAASLGLLIGALSRKEDQVITLSLIAMFVFAALGGAWFPLEVAGKTFAMIGHLMPTAWAMDGFQNILARGLALQSVLAPAAVLLGSALIFFLFAIWRFRYE